MEHTHIDFYLKLNINKYLFIERYNFYIGYFANKHMNCYSPRVISNPLFAQ